jgi:hypothetical protein
MTQEELKSIASKFALQGKVSSIKPLGNGLINDTYKIETEGSAPDYVLQRINNNVFKDVDLLQSNIEAVTRHIRGKLEAAGETDIDRKVLKFIPVPENGKTYYFDGKSYWRISVFIPDAITYEAVTPELSYFAGKSFGDFEAKLVDIPDKLGETIPDFHNMELRISQFADALKSDKAGRVHEGLHDPKGEIKQIIDLISENAEYMCSAEKMFREGKLVKRICHCDTKVNNMLFDDKGNVLCVIDLDTVMPSFVFSDFGDFLRTAANTAAEDEPDTTKISFNMEVFKSFTKGYLESTKSFITPIEKEYLPYAALLFPYMQAVRFFTDYINGDTYYKIKYPDHNLVRTRAQIKLFESVRSHVDDMKKFIAES